MPLSFLTGETGLRRQRDAAQRGIREMFDPSQMNPQMQFAQRRASEGIGRGGEVARTQGLSQIFASDRDRGIYGGNQARAIAGTQAQAGQRSQAQAGLEGQLAQADIEARREGEGMVAQTQAQQRQMGAQRDAQLQQADMMFEAEKSQRRQALGGAALGAVGTIISTPFGDGGSLAARGLQSLFGGGDRGGLGRAGIESRDQAHAQLADARAMDTPEDEMEFDFSMDWGEQGFFGERMSVPQDPMDIPEMQGMEPDLTPLQDLFSGQQVSNEILPELGDEEDFDEWLLNQVGAGSPEPLPWERPDRPGFMDSARLGVNQLTDWLRGPSREEMMERFIQSRQ